MHRRSSGASAVSYTHLDVYKRQVLFTDDPLLKVMGMQLMIEALALTIFQAIRESQAEPVLCELLLYFEKDEARHVGLGLQYLPTQLATLSRWKERRMIAFQVQLLAAALLELKAMEPHMRVLGVDPRQVYLLGTCLLYTSRCV